MYVLYLANQSHNKDALVNKISEERACKWNVKKKKRKRIIEKV